MFTEFEKNSSSGSKYLRKAYKQAWNVRTSKPRDNYNFRLKKVNISRFDILADSVIPQQWHSMKKCSQQLSDLKTFTMHYILKEMHS